MVLMPFDAIDGQSKKRHAEDESEDYADNLSQHAGKWLPSQYHIAETVSLRVSNSR